MTTAASKSQEVWELRFKHFDADNDGRIDRSDFRQEATDIIRAFGADPDLPHARALIASYEGVYDYIASKAGKVGANDEGLSLTDYVSTSLAMITDRGNVGFSQVLGPVAQAIATLCDTDGDGNISREEYGRWLTIVGVADDDAEQSFEQIDANNDGIVSIDELIDAAKKYTLGESDLKMLG